MPAPVEELTSPSPTDGPALSETEVEKRSGTPFPAQIRQVFPVLVHPSVYLRCTNIFMADSPKVDGFISINGWVSCVVRWLIC